MEYSENADLAEIAGKVLVVDDDKAARTLHHGLLARQFDVVTAASGEEALAACREHLPDLVLLDMEMPGLDGLETCRRLRESTTIPIVFATAHQSLDEHLKAYDAGGNDIVVKPVGSEILLRKVALAIRHHQATVKLAEEKDSLQKMAMGFLSSMGESGALLNFMRAGVACRSHRALAEKLVEAARDLGVDCSVLIRHADGPTALTEHGEPTPLELAILEQSSTMGRLFQFGRRLVVNYDRVSIIVANMPDETDAAEQAGRIRDNIAILAETAEALCDNVDMRLESMRRAEQLQIALGGAGVAVESLRENYLRMLGDTRLLLHELVGNVEKSYAWLDTSPAQEVAIGQTMDDSVRRILALLSEGGNFDARFADVLAALRGGQEDMELF
ncbi:MAG: response regulator [Sulfurisoma sp.]|nr:response regulator [Sulfurisoma sp.]